MEAEADADITKKKSWGNCTRDNKDIAVRDAKICLLI